MSSAPDTRRRPHRVHWLPAASDLGNDYCFSRGVAGLGKKFSNRGSHPSRNMDRLTYVFGQPWWFPIKVSVKPTIRAPWSAIGRPLPLYNAMLRHRRAVFVQTQKDRIKAPFTVLESVSPVEVSLRLRECGWVPYRIYLDDKLEAWVALVIDWKRAA
jgi:hypothetical protein